MTNRELLDYLFSTRRLHLTRGLIFDTAPPKLPRKITADRVEGMLLGLAVGDALGMTTEGPGWSVDRRRALFPGGVRDYFGPLRRPDPVDGRGRPSDDTQLAFWTLECMIADGRLDCEKVARLIVERENEIVGRGGTIAEFARRGKENVTPWYDWAPSADDNVAGTGFGPAGLGNGAVMRIAPVLLPHLKTRTADLWVDAALAARMTHNSSISTAASVAFVHLLWRCLGLTKPPEPLWWVEEFASACEPLECEAYPPRRAQGTGAGLRTLAEVVRLFLPKALAKGITVGEACSNRGWGSSSFVLETMPSVLYVLMRHADDFEEGVVTAANDTHDNDTIGALVGAALGALHGKKAIPSRWLKNLPGRTRAEDDGRVFELATASASLWK